MFDPRKAKALAPGEHIIVDESPGLRLVATATRKTWTYRYKNPGDGRMKQVAIGQWPGMSLRNAQAQWHVLKDKRDAGESPADTKRQVARTAKLPAGREPDAYTVGRLVEDYLSGHVDRHRKPKGQKETRRLMTGDYTSAIWSLMPEHVTRKVAFDVLEKLGKRAPVLANTLRTELGAAWDFALDAGRISGETPNWWRQILRGKLRSKGKIVEGKHQGKQYRTLSDDEMKVLLPWLPNFTALEEDLVTLYLWTGARGAEIVAMRGDEITDEADGLWLTVAREKLKMARMESAVDFRVPLIGRAEAIVRRRMALYGDGYLFRPSQKSNFEHTQQKVIGVALWAVRPSTVTEHRPANRAKQLHLKSFSPHDLRRTVRTKISALGCNDYKLAEAIIGHLPAGVEGIYDRHTYDKERRHWLTLVAAHWEMLAAG